MRSHPSRKLQFHPYYSRWRFIECHSFACLPSLSMSSSSV
ncbi:hypothetical protein LEMLEM_LOCUS20105, partial [Lemmus lemmus]